MLLESNVGGTSGLIDPGTLAPVARASAGKRSSKGQNERQKEWAVFARPVAGSRLTAAGDNPFDGGSPTRVCA